MITKIQAPQINSNDTELELSHWYVTGMDFVEIGQDIADLGSSKASFTVQCERAGFIQPLVPKGASVIVGQVIALILDSKEEAQSTQVVPTLSSDETTNTRFSKEARTLLEQGGISPLSFLGKGMITAREILKTGSPTEQLPTPTLPNIPYTSEKVSLQKRSEIESLTWGNQNALSSTLSMQLFAQPLFETLRRNHLFNGSMAPIILNAFSKLILDYPRLNAFYFDGACHYYNSLHIGVAVDLGKGLKVVTVNRGDGLTTHQWFEKLLEISMRYMGGELTPDELAGSTVTVTDLSQQGVAYFQPLLNRFQSAILGIGGIGGDPDQKDHPLSLNLTFDHRVLSGREVALFLAELRRRIGSFEV